ncbi:hypothetical protein P7K49_002595 [Saguinus oedipus]|uniref:Uncharacterized protein n=1 Tax=Saguinus oedipus TaxID=9490 RepID=A0ABQ9WJU1_SAGOE|nr:hypothetical protein P7K49_002595 [Saguinus oedipus]
MNAKKPLLCEAVAMLVQGLLMGPSRPQPRGCSTASALGFCLGLTFGICADTSVHFALCSFQPSTVLTGAQRLGYPRFPSWRVRESSMLTCLLQCSRTWAMVSSSESAFAATHQLKSSEASVGQIAQGCFRCLQERSRTHVFTHKMTKFSIPKLLYSAFLSHRPLCSGPGQPCQVHLVTCKFLELS